MSMAKTGRDWLTSLPPPPPSRRHPAVAIQTFWDQAWPPHTRSRYRSHATHSDRRGSPASGRPSRKIRPPGSRPSPHNCWIAPRGRGRAALFGGCHRPPPLPRSPFLSTSTHSRPTPRMTRAYAAVEPTNPPPTTPTFMAHPRPRNTASSSHLIARPFWRAKSAFVFSSMKKYVWPPCSRLAPAANFGNLTLAIGSSTYSAFS